MKLSHYGEKLQYQLYNTHTHTHTHKYIEKLKNLEKKCTRKLFDIAACKCVPENCKCKKVNKVSKEEQEFLEDQQNIRMMNIAGTDKLTYTELRSGRNDN